MSDILVIKVGGRTIETSEGRRALAEKLAALDASLVVVHGGGAQVTAALTAAGIESKFVGGLRVTTEKSLEVAEPVFAQTGKLLAHVLSEAGVPALALNGRDARLVRATVKDAALGRVGTVTHVASDILADLAEIGLVPVIGPIATDEAGSLNVNADEVASAVAVSLRAAELLLLTDVPAVRGADGAPIPKLTPATALALIESGVAIGGMIPKIHGALEALRSGVARVRITDESGLGKLATGEDAGTVFTGE